MRVLAFCALAVFLPAEARGQCAPPATADSAADVRIFARVQASELRFNTRPRADVAALGCAPADTVRVLVRTNIPDPVVPGETYRNVEVAVEIVTRLSVLCSPALLDLLEVNDAPRLATLCALNSPTGPNRRQP
jgi:hypothetical protein